MGVMDGDIAGVRIIPPTVQFKDTEVKNVYSAHITVKNISKTCKSIRYYGPQTKNFVLKVQNPDKPVAAGLEVPAVVEYTTSQAVEHLDRLVLTVDDDVIEIPLQAIPCRPQLVLQGAADFAQVVANSKVISKHVQIANLGSKSGDFKIKYTGDKPISIMPSSGTVSPGSAIKVKVEYVTKQAGVFDEIAKVKLEGQEPMVLHIKGEVVQGDLLLLAGESHEPVDCIHFGAAYYGTDRTESAILFNNSPDPISFVAVLNDDAVGQEVGVDLSKTTTAMMLDKMNTHNQGGHINDLTSLVTAIPNQGMLAPYEKIPIFFRFSPRWNASSQGFKVSKVAPPRKDFALFLQLNVIGASQGLMGDNDSADTKPSGIGLEVALTGTALPVLLTLSPQSKFDFGECPVGEHVDALCTLRNESPAMSICYQFQRVAHFTSKPSGGKVPAGQSQDVIFSFAPNQVGNFKPCQYLDVLGPVADKMNPFVLQMQVIHSIPVMFLGKSNPITIKKNPVFNPGITPKVTNEVGIYVDTSVGQAKKMPRAAMLNAEGTRLHRLKTSKDKANARALIAFPNDRAQSIRPSDPRETFKTIFTHADRHTYVDPDYAYTDAEAKAVLAHKQYYVDYIDYLRQMRIRRDRNKEFRTTNNETDIAIQPAAGIKPKRLQVDEVKPDPRPPTPPNIHFPLLSTKQLAQAQMMSSMKVCEGLNAVPTTAKEKADCSRALTPQELHQVVFGPATVDFGEVCLRSQSQKELHIINNLDQNIHVVVHVDCRELRQTSPLSQVVPPSSKALLPLIFESNARGRFQRSLDYTINNSYTSHVTVFAEVIPVALELSTHELILQPEVGLPAEAGVRGVIALKNKLNHPAEFTWTPILGDRGTAFSIRPASGMVDAYEELDCEVVFHPSFMAPEDGNFALQVHGGNTLKLQCSAKLGPSNVTFIDRRIMFGQVPLHLTTTRIAMLRNNGQHHAYYQVLDPNPFPGLSVSPLHGVVPVGGTAELMVSLTPGAIMKFDTHVQVAIRGGKTLELRMGGTVEPPCVDIDLPTFDLGGVFCGSSNIVDFMLQNKANTKCRLEFDLSRYSDFALEFPERESAEDYTFQLMNPGMFSITLGPGEQTLGRLTFSPTEVASYDFLIPVVVNQTGAPTPLPTPLPPTPAPSNKNSIQHIINPRPVQVTIATPRRKVIATALRQPLQISHQTLDFTLSPKTHEITSNSGIGHSKATLLVNNSDKEIDWSLDLSRGNQVLEEGVFRFLHSSGMPFLTHNEGGVSGKLSPGQTQSLGVGFCPGRPGFYELSLPINLNGDISRPYMFLNMFGELQAPTLSFDPLAIVLTPVPLDTEVTAEFSILASHYTKHTEIIVEIPEIECEDGSTLTPLTITFPNGQTVKPASSPEPSDPCVISCKLSFKAPQPMSFSRPVFFKDEMGNSFPLMVTATADNCLLTCYPFLAQHRNDHQIVCEQGTSLKGRRTASRESMNVGEAVLLPCNSPQRPSSRPSTTATSSNFEISSSSYESSSQSVTESTFPSTPRDGALNKFTTESEAQSRSRQQDMTSRSLGSALFPEEDSEEGIFHTEVLLAVQRWYSSQGWAGGPHPIIIPHSLRSGLSKKPREEKAKKAKGGTWDANNLKKEFKTVYDMISHLCGKPVPGIPLNNSLPNDPVERAKQVYWQHSTLLTFLKTQGACIASIKPEYLMELIDYKVWVKLQKAIVSLSTAGGHHPSNPKTEEEEALEDQLFEAVSKRAWTDILLQLLKTLVLSKITPRQFRKMPTPYKDVSLPMVDPDPLCSNVYSLGERILLVWLNLHYEQHRQNIWENSTRGGVPPSRWIVNFDFDLLDGLVLAAAIGAHAPFVIKSHLSDMYTYPRTAEQCLHNALKVVTALRYIGIDYDIQAIDITDPNPISLLLLCAHLYWVLPNYLPCSTVDFIGALHSNTLRQVRLSNPSNKPLTYQALIAGHDADDFNLPKGMTIVIPPKAMHNLGVEFNSRFLRPAEGVLVLVGRRQGSNVGTTLVFTLQTQIDNITPTGTVKCEAPCYTVHKINVEVTNPFEQGGEFSVMLVESQESFPDPNNGSFSPNSSSGGAPAVRPSKRRAKARIDHGQRSDNGSNLSKKEDSPTQEMALRTKFEDTTMSAFSCPVKSIKLAGKGQGQVELHFLPFQVGPRHCTLIFVNEAVGEFLYAVDAVALEPEASTLPHTATEHSTRMNSAAAAGPAFGLFGGDDHVIYWKCDVGQELKECLTIPIVNDAREQALAEAARQDDISSDDSDHMSDVEIHRRAVTGTLECATVTTQTIGRLSAGNTSAKKRAHTNFHVEIDSPYFSAPKTFKMPAADKNITETQLPVKFKSNEPGHYPCRIVLTSLDDIRVYHIECTVAPQGSEAQLEFSAPTHQAITQDIPVVNTSEHDWHMEATIAGMGFVGPSNLVVKAGTTASYSLIFRPQVEGEVEGSLVLRNLLDQVEHTFHLKGIGQRPLPVEHLIFHSQVKQSVSKTIQIPNITKKKLHYRAESNLSFVSGEEFVTVLPGKSVEYELSLVPTKRGSFKGVLTFVAGPNPIKTHPSHEVDSDGDDIPDIENTDDLHGYRVWFSIEVHVEPGPPEKSLEISCACQKRAVLEVGLNNPLDEEMLLTAEILPTNLGLRGTKEKTLRPNERTVYELEYAPAIVGNYSASLVFYNDFVGEFWYDLSLTATSPGPTTLPSMECELGRWVRQYITLNNPTDETLMLIPTISNGNNFTLERDNERPIELRAYSSLKLPLMFMPSTLGSDHRATITFHCEQLGEWIYFVSGSGRLPQPQDPVSITALAGSNSTLIIPFRNPLDVPVLIDVVLSAEGQECSMEEVQVLSEEPEGSEQESGSGEAEPDKQFDTAMGKEPEVVVNKTSPFCLLLRHDQGMRLGPKSTIDIPISFAPEDMRMFQALVTVTVRQEDDKPWVYDLTQESTELDERSKTAELFSIEWSYPIRGYPELTSHDGQPAVIMCQARTRVEERLEVTLSGVVPSAGGPKRGIKARAKTPAGESPKTPEQGVVVGEALAKAEEFTHEIIYGNDSTKKELEPAIALSLVRQQRDKHTGLVILIFNVIYAPYRTMEHDVQLLVKGATGGLWRFPLTFQATEPEPDDNITIEAVGLNKESAIGFRLSSQTRHPVPFNAYFVAGSDTEFRVSPQSGELAPVDAKPTLITVHFIPSKYGKKYHGKLVVQSPDMQWTYNIMGVLPDYIPPRGLASRPMAGPHPDPRQRPRKVNYVRNNLKLLTTAVSSPIKGAPVVIPKVGQIL